jgi:hypothetical protein
VAHPVTVAAPARFWTQFRQAPWALRYYLVFAIAACLLGFSVFVAPRFHATLVPYTGWSGLTCYLFTVQFAVSAIRSGKRQPVYVIALMLALYVFFGAIEVFRHAAYPPTDNTNPYLAYHSSRIVFVMALPIAWILLLLSPLTLRKLQPGVPWQREEDSVGG